MKPEEAIRKLEILKFNHLLNIDDLHIGEYEDAIEEGINALKKQIEKPQTNADKIRAMSDEELAEMLFEDCKETMKKEVDDFGNCKEYDCQECILEWLKKEVEDGEINNKM